eukprot:762599-Hanusia_phi.AAC.3
MRMLPRNCAKREPLGGSERSATRKHKVSSASQWARRSRRLCGRDLLGGSDDRRPHFYGTRPPSELERRIGQSPEQRVSLLSRGLAWQARGSWSQEHLHKGKQAGAAYVLWPRSKLLISSLPASRPGCECVSETGIGEAP